MRGSNVKKVFLAIVLAFSGISSGAQAALVDVPFFFTNSIGDTAGTVSGRIRLDDAVVGVQAASNVFIDTYPAGLTGTVDNGLDAVAWVSGPSVNTFTLGGGSITAASFASEQFVPSDSDRLSLNFTDGSNFLTFSNVNFNPPNCNGASSTCVLNKSGLPGVTFGEPVAAVPLPAALPLFLSGLLLFGFVMRRRHKQGALQTA
jgi:hypothetical protein